MAMTRQDILEAMGIDTGRGGYLWGLAGFGIGCLVGAAAAVLLAPKSGADLRADLFERGRDLVQRGKQSFHKEPSKDSPAY
jgi:predicted cobalt transporter CbtA